MYREELWKKGFVLMGGANTFCKLTESDMGAVMNGRRSGLNVPSACNNICKAVVV